MVYFHLERDESHTTKGLTAGNTGTGTSGANANADADANAGSAALDDTAGWRALETSLHSLGSWIGGTGGRYLEEGAAGGNARLILEEAAAGTDLSTAVNTELLTVLESCCTVHINRHVRAAGLQTLDTIVQAIAAADQNNACTTLLSPASALTATLLAVLKLTLADNWSQVRMASSFLCRTYLTTVNAISLTTSNDSVALTPAAYATLLPRMCLNRFYLAQGVKLYSQETWQTVFHTNGLPLIRTHAGAVARYYTRMADADNHVVREAACQAIAELASKLGGGGAGAEALAPFVPLLLQALLVCFHDESWPVRDEACLACGIFVGSYPLECQPELPTLTERWTFLVSFLGIQIFQ
mmetsp:Transcript_55045/g.66278  ORF Transcript_55045/g.66278 Transcript_55045/m.66278 type:complete len:356 (+) Transcript_55045:2-1069(+)